MCHAHAHHQEIPHQGCVPVYITFYTTVTGSNFKTVVASASLMALSFSGTAMSAQRQSESH